MNYTSNAAICCALAEGITYLHVEQSVVVSYCHCFGTKRVSSTS